MQLASQLQGQAGLGRGAGTAGSDLGNHLGNSDAEQLALLRQLQLSGQYPSAPGNNTAAGAHSAFGSVSSAPGAGFRAPSPLAVGGQRVQSPAFGASFGGGMSPAYSTTSLPGGLGLGSRPGSAFGSTGISGAPIATDPVIRRPSPSPSMASHASKQGSSKHHTSFSHAPQCSPSSSQPFQQYPSAFHFVSCALAPHPVPAWHLMLASKVG